MVHMINKKPQYNFVDITGSKYGRWLVISRAENTRKKYGKRQESRTVWLCKCECGNEKIVDGNSLKQGNSQSCGCLKKEKCAFALSLLIGGKHWRYIKDRQIAIDTHLFSIMKGKAKTRGLNFELTLEQLSCFIHQSCYYCGSLPSNIYTNNHQIDEKQIYNGLDRIDNSKGYIEGNVVPCCKRCNTAKNDMSKDEFINWISRVYDYSVEDTGSS